MRRIVTVLLVASLGLVACKPAATDRAPLRPNVPPPIAQTTTPSPTPPATTPPAATMTSTQTRTTTQTTTRTTTQTTTQAPIQGVHQGAFCSEHYQYGYTVDHTLMRCITTATDSRFRWRAA